MLCLYFQTSHSPLDHITNDTALRRLIMKTASVQRGGGERKAKRDEAL